MLCVTKRRTIVFTKSKEVWVVALIPHLKSINGNTAAEWLTPHACIYCSLAACTCVVFDFLFGEVRVGGEGAWPSTYNPL